MYGLLGGNKGTAWTQTTLSQGVFNINELLKGGKSFSGWIISTVCIIIIIIIIIRNYYYLKLLMLLW